MLTTNDVLGGCRRSLFIVVHTAHCQLPRTGVRYRTPRIPDHRADSQVRSVSPLSFLTVELLEDDRHLGGVAENLQHHDQSRVIELPAYSLRVVPDRSKGSRLLHASRTFSCDTRIRIPVQPLPLLAKATLDVRLAARRVFFKRKGAKGASRGQGRQQSPLNGHNVRAAYGDAKKNTGGALHGVYFGLLMLLSPDSFLQPHLGLLVMGNGRCVRLCSKKCAAAGM